MKFIHTSDLHIGRNMHGFDLLEDQRHILVQILKIAKEEAADGILLAGDIYDRAVPSAGAVRLFDWFLTALYEEGIPCYIISGNHDSGERLSFAGKILEQKNIYIGSSWEQGLMCVRREDEYGELCIWLLPFLRPAAVRAMREAQEISGREQEGSTAAADREAAGEAKPEASESRRLALPTAQEAVEYMLSTVRPDPGVRNILVTHYFVTDGEHMPEVSDSENTLSMGGIDCVTADVFADFDYTALGHLHGPQKIGKGQVWYAGSPLKYSSSEALQEKGVWVVELKEKGNVAVRQRPLFPLHDVRRIRGSLKELMGEEVRSLADPEDYVFVSLTDEEELLDPMTALRGVYPNVCELLLEKNLAAGTMEKETADLADVKSDEELFGEFYRKVTGRELDEEHLQIARWMMEQAKEEAQ